MLVTGIMEMKHADIYIDVTEFTDEEILEHPIFIHNFVMCILSIFVMTLYLVQAWVLFDLWQWVRKHNLLLNHYYILFVIKYYAKYIFLSKLLILFVMYFRNTPHFIKIYVNFNHYRLKLHRL